MARHPRPEVLTRWLDGDTDISPKVDEHIENCEYCASQLDTIFLTASNDSPEPSEIGPALLTILSPPEDLHERISARLAARLQRRQDVELFGSMFGVPRQAGDIFLGEGSPESPKPVTENDASETD